MKISRISRHLLLFILPIVTLAIEGAEAVEENAFIGVYDGYRAAILAGDVEKALSFRTDEVVNNKRWRFGIGHSDDKQNAQSLLMELPDTYEVQHLAERNDGVTADLYVLWHMSAQTEWDRPASTTEVTISFQRENGTWKMGEFTKVGDPAKIARPRDYIYDPNDAVRDVETFLSGRIVETEFKENHTLILLRDFDREFAVFLPPKGVLQEYEVHLENYAAWNMREFTGNPHKTDELKFFANGDRAVATAPESDEHAMPMDNVLRIDGEDIPITHVYAQLRDNTEGLLDYPSELRILLSDRELPQSALNGISSLPAMDMAMEGKLRGLLIQMNPADRKTAYVTLLYPPKEADMSLSTQTRTSSDGDVIRNLEISENSVSGEIEERGDTDPFFQDTPNPIYKITFSTAVVPAPAVTADLKGKEAIASPQAEVFRKKADAMTRGDLAAIMAVCTDKVNRMTKAYAVQAGPETFKKVMKQHGTELGGMIKQIERVVVRGDSAVALLPEGAFVRFVKEGTAWKSDN